MTEERRQLALSAMIDEGGYIDGDATVRLFDAIKGKGVKVVESEGVVKPPAPAGPIYVLCWFNGSGHLNRGNYTY